METNHFRKGKAMFEFGFIAGKQFQQAGVVVMNRTKKDLLLVGTLVKLRLYTLFHIFFNLARLQVHA